MKVLFGCMSLLSMHLAFGQLTIQKSEFFGYPNCIVLQNKTTKVVVDPNVGGRLLYYGQQGNNILFENRDLDGKLWKEGDPTFEVSGGRFDIGPAQTTTFRKSFFNTWEAEIRNDTVRLTSPKDHDLGIQLVRDFILDPETSKLTCIQHIKNISNSPKRFAHWSRTFAEGGGICLVPMNPHSRLPMGYAMYLYGTKTLDFNPKKEENLRLRDGILEFLGPPSNPKFVMDSNEGWLAYISRDDQLFVKKFEASDDKIYGDMLSNQVSIWYYKNEKCEIEPIGPLEFIQPGQQISFTEKWWLLDYTYPEDKKANLPELLTLIKNLN
nr:hypothetical protein [Allomuricauda sp.]